MNSGSLGSTSTEEVARRDASITLFTIKPPGLPDPRSVSGIRGIIGTKVIDRVTVKLLPNAPFSEREQC